MLRRDPSAFARAGLGVACLDERQRVLVRELTETLGCSDEELMPLAQPLSEKGLALLCLNLGWP